MQDMLFRMLCSGVDRLHDEVRHPVLSSLSRRAFAKLIGALVAVSAARRAGALLPFGECDRCGARSCHSECGVRTWDCACDPSLCRDNNCWCERHGERGWKLVCDCTCDGADCECTMPNADDICGSKPGKHPGDLF